MAGTHSFMTTENLVLKLVLRRVSREKSEKGHLRKEQKNKKPNQVGRKGPGSNTVLTQDYKSSHFESNMVKANCVLMSLNQNRTCYHPNMESEESETMKL